MVKRVRRLTWRSAILAGALFLPLGATAYADPIGPDCGAGNCFGSIYTLTSQLISAGSTTSTYNLTLTVDTSGYNGPGSGLNAVAIKTISKTSNATSASLLSGPATFTTAAFSGLNANGCSGPSPSGFLCSQSSSSTGVPVPNGTYTFTFQQSVTNGSLLTAAGAASVKALYVDATGKQAGLTSAPITIQPVPIPGTFLLFGAGFAGFVMWQWSRGPRRIDAAV
jgi:hypothetical protein